MGGVSIPICVGRMVLAFLLLISKQGVFVLEQPKSSLLYRHPRFQQLLRLVKAGLQVTCLKHTFVDHLL